MAQVEHTPVPDLVLPVPDILTRAKDVNRTVDVMNQRESPLQSVSALDLNRHVVPAIPVKVRKRHAGAERLVVVSGKLGRVAEVAVGPRRHICWNDLGDARSCRGDQGEGYHPGEFHKPPWV